MSDLNLGEEEEPVQTDCKSVEGKRWLDGGYLASNIAVITEEVAAITTKQLDLKQ